ncbi:hypothetical protein C7212DRAFT_352758 [Tuber magnatum]|uniref:Uncharacterized protein n=1 Tax=Tuber magnatum TaxID=42249 RepID=A0A317SLN4_9PEZI|nr:hypothetical protein C7212DRAFT_352758 [Tuber magnatum]
MGNSSLIAEEKGIYAGLVMIEAESSQHPSARPTLRRLADKCATLALMWRHRIYISLELLRHGLPYLLEHMLTFISLAYTIMALYMSGATDFCPTICINGIGFAVLETVSPLEGTWAECPGDLGRVWVGVARFWYSKATDKTPSVGRLFHHSAVLAGPNVLQLNQFKDFFS